MREDLRTEQTQKQGRAAVGTTESAVKRIRVVAEAVGTSLPHLHTFLRETSRRHKVTCRPSGADSTEGHAVWWLVGEEKEVADVLKEAQEKFPDCTLYSNS